LYHLQSPVANNQCEAALLRPITCSMWPEWRKCLLKCASPPGRTFCL